MAEAQNFPCPRTISGTARFIDADCHHVLRFHIKRTLFDNAVHWLAAWLPPLAQPWLRVWIPSSFLPHNVVLKKLKPDWDAEFDREKKVYEQLKPLRGHVIPVFYGERTCGGRRTIVLSEVGGVNLYSEQFEHVAESPIKEKLQHSIRAILELGVEPGDHNPRNYHIDGDTVFVVDFEDTAEVDRERVEERRRQR
ncbi:hypothetical protein OQA88_12595 [Cercophora sp. LCS_1]